MFDLVLAQLEVNGLLRHVIQGRHWQYYIPFAPQMAVPEHHVRDLPGLGLSYQVVHMADRAVAGLNPHTLTYGDFALRNIFMLDRDELRAD